MPRGAPQCRHLIGVEAGAFSSPSKTIPMVSQFTQTILKSKRSLIALLALLNRAGERNMIAQRRVWAGQRNCPVI